MPKRSWMVGPALLVTICCGCATSNRIVGHNMIEIGDWYGELGVNGDLNQVTVQRGSRVSKLSILGDANIIRVEEGVTLPKVEIWGGRNTVFVPQYLLVRVSQVGNGNQVVRYPPGTDLGRLNLESVAPAGTQPGAGQPQDSMDIDLRPANESRAGANSTMTPTSSAPPPQGAAEPVPERNPWITYEGETPPAGGGG